MKVSVAITLLRLGEHRTALRKPQHDLGHPTTTVVEELSFHESH